MGVAPYLGVVESLIVCVMKVQLQSGGGKYGWDSQPTSIAERAEHSQLGVHFPFKFDFIIRSRSELSYF